MKRNPWPRSGRSAPPAGLVVLALCVAACLANPSTFRVFLGRRWHPCCRIFGPETDFSRSVSSPTSASRSRSSPGRLVLVHWFLSAHGRAWAGLVPAERAPVRLEPVPAVRGDRGVWGVFMRLRPGVRRRLRRGAALNGQEWYHDRFGTEGRLGCRLDPLVDRRPAGDAGGSSSASAWPSPAGAGPRTTRGSASRSIPTTSPSRPPSTWPAARTSRATS